MKNLFKKVAIILLSFFATTAITVQAAQMEDEQSSKRSATSSTQELDTREAKKSRPAVNPIKQDEFRLTINRNDLTAVEKFLASDLVDPNKAYETGTTALMDAAALNLFEMAELLIKWGANPNYKDTAGTTPIEEAIIANNPRMLQLLLKKGADPNYKAKFGTRPIRKALTNNHLEIFKLLLEAGAYISSQDLAIIQHQDAAVKEQFNNIIENVLKKKWLQWYWHGKGKIGDQPFKSRLLLKN